jgi:hypothetical protein
MNVEIGTEAAQFPE